MARRVEERVPLLSDEEAVSRDEDLEEIQVSFRQQQGNSERAHAPRAALPFDGANLPSAELSGLAAAEEETETGTGRRKHYSGNEMIVAVFVVQFDIRRGETEGETNSSPSLLCIGSH